MTPSKQEYIHPEAQRMSAQPPVSAAPSAPSIPMGRPAPERAIQPERREEPKVGRNDPCPCGSGKKHKKCHGQ